MQLESREALVVLWFLNFEDLEFNQKVIQIYLNLNPSYLSSEILKYQTDQPLGRSRRQMKGIKNMVKIWNNLWLTHVEVWQKKTKFCKAIILQLKNKQILKTYNNALV